MQARFDKIGPYDLTRGDVVAAAFVISFITGSVRARMSGVVLVLAGAVAIGFALTVGPFIVAPGTLFALALIYVIAPALRSRKGARDICVSDGPEGIVVETAEARTVYKWVTIGKVRKVGSRLYIMISPGYALVISDRATDAGNMARLCATVMRDRAASSH